MSLEQRIATLESTVFRQQAQLDRLTAALLLNDDKNVPPPRRPDIVHGEDDDWMYAHNTNQPVAPQPKTRQGATL